MNYFNHRPIRVSRVRHLSRALLATGFPYDIRTSQENNFNYFRAMALASQAVRRAGSAAMDLCDLACGRFDGFWELKLKPWDIAAGSLLVTEAGGKMSPLAGGPFYIGCRDVVASNGLIHRAMQRIIRSVHK
jgi:myo-inositol-1(or 4)-monophosphatase